MDGNSELQGLGQSKQEGLNPNGQVLKTRKSRRAKLASSFSSVFGKEKTIDGHKVRFDIVPIKHGADDETKYIRNRFQNQDLLILELFGWDKDYLNELRMLSRREITTEDLLKNRSHPNELDRLRDESLFRFLYESNKPITFIDVPKDNALLEKYKEIKFPKNKIGSNFDEYVRSVNDYIVKYSEFQLEREDFMIRQIIPSIQEAINNYPQLSRKEDLSILLSIGDAHGQFFTSL